MRELDCVSGVAHFSIQREHKRIPAAECDQRIAVCLSGGHLLANGIVRQLHFSLHRFAGFFPGTNWSRARAAHCQVANAAEFRDRTVGHLRWKWLAMPVWAVLDFRETAPFDSLCQEDCWLPASGLFNLRQCSVDRCKVVAVDH